MKLLIIAVDTDRPIRAQQVHIAGLGGTLAAVECIDPPPADGLGWSIVEAAQRAAEALEDATAGRPNADAPPQPIPKPAPPPAPSPDDLDPRDYML